MYRVRNEKHETLFETCILSECIAYLHAERAKGNDVYAQMCVRLNPYAWDYGWIEIF
jgi:hypothetical protein